MSLKMGAAIMSWSFFIDLMTLYISTIIQSLSIRLNEKSLDVSIAIPESPSINIGMIVDAALSSPLPRLDQKLPPDSAFFT